MQVSDQHRGGGPQVHTLNRDDSSNAGDSKNKGKGITIIEPAPSHLLLFSRIFLKKPLNQNVMGRGKLGGQKRLLLALILVLGWQQRLLLPLLKI